VIYLPSFLPVMVRAESLLWINAFNCSVLASHNCPAPTTSYTCIVGESNMLVLQSKTIGGTSSNASHQIAFLTFRIFNGDKSSPVGFEFTQN
jgi:hypothetical protein